MKIKEVCKRTNLTERTVRFYVEESLIDPKSSWKNGREYRDYSEQDVAELITIAELRKLFFSISEIKAMKESPAQIMEIVSAYKEKMHTDAVAKASIVQMLDQVNLSELTDIHVLTSHLKNVSVNLELPKRDINPNFGRWERETKEDREREYQRFKAYQERQFRIGRIIVYVIAFLQLTSTIVSAWTDFNVFTFLLSIALTIALVAGVSWVRYFFIFSAAITLFLGILALTSLLFSISVRAKEWVMVMQVRKEEGKVRRK